MLEFRWLLLSWHYIIAANPSELFIACVVQPYGIFRRATASLLVLLVFFESIVDFIVTVVIPTEIVINIVVVIGIEVVVVIIVVVLTTPPRILTLLTPLRADVTRAVRLVVVTATLRPYILADVLAALLHVQHLLTDDAALVSATLRNEPSANLWNP